jgi:hypothetical protein
MQRARLAVLFSMVCLLVAGAMAACGSGDSGGSGFTTPGPDATNIGPTPPPFADAGAGDGPSRTLTIFPQNPVLNVSGPGQTLQFTAFLSGEGADGGPVPAVWNLDSAQLGTIDGNGLFTFAGTAGGIVTVDAEAGGAKAQTSLTVRLIITDDNPGSVDGATKARLRAGGTSDPAFAWLYPYDQTVFPRGLLAPLLQFAGTPAQAFRLVVKSKLLEYEGFFGGSDPARLDMGQALWRTITLSAQPLDPVTVQVTKAFATDGGLAVAGPITETWTIAQGSLKGFVYYNSYDSLLARGDAGGGNDMGAVMRIRPNAAQPEVFIGGAQKGSCTVCHTVSANGSVLAVSAGHTFDGTYRIEADAQSPLGPMATGPDNRYSFAALTPDGKLALTCGSQDLDAGVEAGLADGGAPSGEFGPNLVSMTAEQDTMLFNAEDGGVVLASILDGGVRKAKMPAFSPDGRKVAFNHWEVGQGHSLSVLDFNPTTRTFSNLVEIVRDSTGNYLGWPSFLPDGKAFVYQLGDRDDYATWRSGSGELFVVDLATKNEAKLRLANGERNGASYLQSRAEMFMNYEPSVLPVSVGGYHWVVFTSRRRYGNVITETDQDEPVRKKLWVAALDINAPPGTDPSHPAFFLQGQEIESGNLRGFWVLEPCRQVGNSCESGSECCTGFCRGVAGPDGGAQFVCVAPPTTCAREEEKCTQTSDCCDAPRGFACINGFCARPTPK